MSREHMLGKCLAVLLLMCCGCVGVTHSFAPKSQASIHGKHLSRAKVDEDPIHADHATSAPAETRNSQPTLSIEELQEMLSGTPTTRINACKQLAAIGVRATDRQELTAVALLVDVLKFDSDQDVRLAATKALDIIHTHREKDPVVCVVAGELPDPGDLPGEIPGQVPTEISKHRLSGWMRGNFTQPLGPSTEKLPSSENERISRLLRNWR